MQVMFEWRTGDPPPDGLISLAVRLTDAENTGELLIPS